MMGMHQLAARLTLAAALVCGLATGCAGEPDEPAAQSENVRSFPVIDAELGDSFDLSVEARTGTQTTERHAKVLRVRVGAGQAFAVVMRVTSETLLDPYLALYSEQVGSDAVATAKRDQSALPMAGDLDEMIVYTSPVDQELLVFASDTELEEAGSFQIDLVPLRSAPDVDWSFYSPGREHVVELMAAAEGELAERTDAGQIVELPTGFVEADLSDVPLRDRNAASGFANRQNEYRTAIFDSFDAPDLAGDVGVTLGELWDALRSPSHALR